jgi:hypothetical protein
MSQAPAARPTLHLHLYGEPGAGKSTLAAALYAHLKVWGVNAELVQEYAKELVWAGTLAQTPQPLIHLEQLRRESLRHGRVDVVVSDSPPLLGAAYLPGPEQLAAGRALLQAQRHWRRINLFVARGETLSYEQTGRAHDRLQAQAKRAEIRALLNALGEPIRVEIENTPSPHYAQRSEWLFDQLPEIHSLPGLRRTASLPLFIEESGAAPAPE